MTLKTKEELNALRNEVETLNKKLAELSDEELKMVTGGTSPYLPATKLPEIAFNGMFNCCSDLTTAPDLPAQNLLPGAYEPDENK